MDKVIYIGYFVAGYKKNYEVFLHWQHREKCPEVIKTYNNRCANLILCNTCIIIIYNNIIQIKKGMGFFLIYVPAWKFEYMRVVPL
jgi:hypothetical protein